MTNPKGRFGIHGGHHDFLISMKIVFAQTDKVWAFFIKGTKIL